MKKRLTNFVDSVCTALVDYINQPRYFFLVTAVIFGLPLLFFRPAWDVSDFGAHYAKAYDIAQGNIIPNILDGDVINPHGNLKSVGGMLPLNVGDLTYVRKGDLSDEALHSLNQSEWSVMNHQPDSKKVAVEYNTSAIYNPLSYLPQIIGLMVANITHLTLFEGIILASLFNFCTWLFLVYWAIKITPVGKWLIVFLNLLPTNFSAAPSFSTDAVLLATTCLFFAYLMKLSEHHNLTIRKAIPLVWTAFMISTFKQAYFVIGFAVIILKKKFVSIRQFWLTLGLCAGSCVFMVVLWAYMSRNINYIAPWSHPHEQIKLALHAPWKLIIEAWNVLTHSTAEVFVGYFGKVSNSMLNLWSVVFLAVGLILCFYYELVTGGIKRLSLTVWQRTVLCLIIVVSTGLILGALYVYWTHPYRAFIEGVQGRYFLPLTILLLPIFYLKEGSLKINPNTALRIVQLIVLVGLSSMTYMLAKLYYL